MQVAHRGRYVIVPHHLLNGQQIAAILNNISPLNEKTKV
jgi:hypothetical protein